MSDVKDFADKLAKAVRIVRPFNVQLAIHAGSIYVIELNPRASRALPFSSKATGVGLAAAVVNIMAGKTIAELKSVVVLPDRSLNPNYFAVKEAVMPFSRFAGTDVMLGPEMKSTGEVIGIAESFPLAYAKTRLVIDYDLAKSGKVFISVCGADKRAIDPVALSLNELGFDLVATSGTACILRALGLKVEVLSRIHDGLPNDLDLIKNDELTFIINAPQGHDSKDDGFTIRSAAVERQISCITALSAANA